MPAMSSVTKRFQFIRRSAWPYIQKKGRGRIFRPRPVLRSTVLLDGLVLAVDDLEDVELRSSEVAVRGEADRRAEDRGRQRDLREILAELGARDLLVLARLRDRVRVHLREHVVRCAERARGAGE